MSKKLLDRKGIRVLLAAIFWIAVWQIAALSVGKELLLPKPLTALRALLDAVRDAKFWLIVGKSLLRVFGGFVIGALIGVLLAVLTACSKLCDTLLTPAVRMVRAVPVASFIILAQLWLKSTILPAFIAALIVVPVVWSNVREGIAQTDRGLLEVAQVYRFSRGKTLHEIYIPMVAPYFSSACLTSMGLAWKSGIAAEVLCQPKQAVGTQLYLAKTYFNTDQLFAWTIVVIVLSFLVEVALTKLLKRLGGRRK